MKKEQKIFKRIKRLTGQAVGDFNLIENNDRILVAISGGKDSWAMLHVLTELCRRAPIHYELIPVTVDSGFGGFDTVTISQYLKEHGFDAHIEKTNAKQRIDAHLQPGTSYCAFCARLRRGALYATATKLRCNKIALGHHLDDHIETLLLNQFYSGTIAAMSPKLMADNGIHTVIRPLVYVEESLIEQWARLKKIPQVDCSCPELARRDQKRQRIKSLIAELHAESPLLKKSLLKAMANVQPRHLLDKELKS
ncbi:MAG: tRNA 2-thiocytidine(32) synthetase TtcA [Thermodesulfobacteriota bacterium]|nr:tRNA 2-thiocytidine(32) synthetase TtcA [Thermodesulfobacteriota bacterium]